MTAATIEQSLTKAKQVALHLQALGIENNLEYELDYIPAACVDSSEMIKAIKLMLSPEQAKLIVSAVMAESCFDSSIYDKFLSALPLSLLVGENGTIQLNCQRWQSSPVLHNVYYVGLNGWSGNSTITVEKIAKGHMTPFKRYAFLS